ncbi:hypothetical protein GCM10010191_45670 [Actinomadura vinacea]|uniref:Uncharacterized protein n=1 Tax=Actinomadura vinacea TaxID=115336 RepID=A0ABN3JDB7_9ACTN
MEPPVTEGGLRGWAVGRVTEADVPDAGLPPLDPARDIKLADLTTPPWVCPPSSPCCWSPRGRKCCFSAPPRRWRSLSR